MLLSRLHRRRSHLRHRRLGPHRPRRRGHARTRIPDANLDSITAVVIGGTSLFGGRGGWSAPLLGALIVCVVHLRAVPRGRRPAVPAPRHRCAGHRRRRGRPVDQEGEGMSTIERLPLARRPHPRAPSAPVRGRRRSCRPAAWSRPSAGSSASTASTSTSTGVRCSRSSATTAPASRPSSSASPAPTRRTPARSGSTASRSSFKRPQDAREAGIETVYQTLAVIPALDIASNLYLAREERRPGPLGSVLRMLDKKGMKRARRRLGAEARHPDDPEHGSGGRDAVRWPAPGGRGGARRGVREQGGRPRRADRRPGRQGVGDGPRHGQAAARQRAWP